MTPSEFIEMTEYTFGHYPEYSMGCLKFGLMLSELFDGKMYYNSGHIVTKIDNRYYDQKGVYTEIGVDYLPAEAFGFNYFSSAFMNLPDIFHLKLREYFKETL